MEALKQWFTAITGIIILSAIGEGILPSGNIKKVVRILFGIIMVMAVCGPFIKGMPDKLEIAAEYKEPYEVAENMEEKERENVLRLYKANLAQKIAESIKSVTGDNEVEIQTDIETQNMADFGQVRGVTVVIRTENEELYLNDEIEEIISADYKIPKKNIAIKYAKK